MFLINTSALPRIYSHQHAERFFDETDPGKSRRWDTSTRPLGRRNDTSKRIGRSQVDDQGNFSYALIYHATEMVTYHPDGKVCINTHNSRNSAAFLGRLLPSGLDVVMHCGQMMIKAATADGTAWYPGGHLRFSPVVGRSGYWELLSPPAPRRRRKLCRKAAAKIRAAAKPFLMWAQATEKLVGNGFATSSIRQSWLTLPKSIEALENPDTWGEIAGAYFMRREKWMHTLYDRLDAYLIYQIDFFEPPKPRSGSVYS